MTREEIIRKQQEYLTLIQEFLPTEQLQWVNFVLDDDSKLGIWIANSQSEMKSVELLLNSIKK